MVGCDSRKQEVTARNRNGRQEVSTLAVMPFNAKVQQDIMVAAPEHDASYINCAGWHWQISFI